MSGGADDLPACIPHPLIGTSAHPLINATQQGSKQNQGGKRGVHGVSGSWGRCFTMNRPSRMLVTTIVPLLKKG